MFCSVSLYILPTLFLPFSQRWDLPILPLSPSLRYIDSLFQNRDTHLTVAIYTVPPGGSPVLYTGIPPPPPPPLSCDETGMVHRYYMPTALGLSTHFKGSVW
jgi:hypothetical protein